MPEGFAQDGWMTDDSEVDFWQVWRAVADAYNLAPDRTVVGGYSIGGYAAYKLGLEYPDVFAEELAMAGPPVCGIGVYPGIAADSGPGRCTSDGDTGPLVGNAEWLPYVMADGGAAETVPVTGQYEQVSKFDGDNERYTWFLYPAMDHLVWPTLDEFGQEAGALGDPTRTTRPGTIDYTWYPDLVDTKLGLEATQLWWIDELAARTSTPGGLAHVVAASHEIREPAQTPVRTTTPQPMGQPAPDVEKQLTWVPGSTPSPASEIDLTLTDVGRLRLNLAEAGFGPDPSGSISVATDGTMALSLTNLGPEAALTLDGASIGDADADGDAGVTIPAGTHRIACTGTDKAQQR